MFQSTSAQVWGQRLDRFDHADMTVAQFCLQEGVSQASLYQWRRKLRGNASANKNGQPTNGQPTNGQRTNGKRTNGKANTPPSFLPVSLPTRRRSTPLPIPATTPTSLLTPPTLMTVELPGGVRIRLEFPTDHEQAIPTEARS